MILITGAAGFIGSNLVASLARRETRGLIVCDWLGNEEKWRNIGKYEISDFVHPENLLDYLDQNSDKISIVYHLGAISSTTETNADLIIQNNFCLSRDLWDWCAKNDISFIYASSAATYGNGENNFDDLNSCEALVHLNCQTAIEAVMLGKEPISLEWINTPHLKAQAPPGEINHNPKSFNELVFLMCRGRCVPTGGEGGVGGVGTVGVFDLFLLRFLFFI